VTDAGPAASLSGLAIVGIVSGVGASPKDLAVLLRAAGIEGSVLKAFERVDRALFVPPAGKDEAYDDDPIPIGHGQVTTQPSLMAMMVEALQLTSLDRVLEVGTGFGFQTALLAVLAREVFSIERIPALAHQARANLCTAGIRNATVVIGDGSLGCSEHAPYDAIVVAAAAPSVSPRLTEQLVEGGRLVQPLGRGGNEVVTLFRRRGAELRRERVLTYAFFVPLLGVHGIEEHMSAKR
jgi:protein-L-isoaspartate(D-aspartate) O-methyltransferase